MSGTSAVSLSKTDGPSLYAAGQAHVVTEEWSLKGSKIFHQLHLPSGQLIGHMTPLLEKYLMLSFHAVTSPVRLF